MPPRNDEQNEVVRQESRARLLAQALELFAEHGYDRTTVRMIAEKAGIAQGLLYNYFAGKEALLHALFAQSMEKVQESFVPAMAAAPQAKLEALLRASFAIVQRDARFFRVSYSVRMQPAVLAGLGGHLPAWTQQIRGVLSGLLKAAGSKTPDVEAFVLFGLIDGVCQQVVLEPDAYPLEDVIQAILARYGPARKRAPRSPRPSSRPRKSKPRK
jgi:AcrR family transcriptional regulator